MNAHGTGTDWNDRTETTVIKNVLGDQARRTMVVANKGALGHGISAGGALELHRLRPDAARPGGSADHQPHRRRIRSATSTT